KVNAAEQIRTREARNSAVSVSQAVDPQWLREPAGRNLFEQFGLSLPASRTSHLVSPLSGQTLCQGRPTKRTVQEHPPRATDRGFRNVSQGGGFHRDCAKAAQPWAISHAFEQILANHCT